MGLETGPVSTLCLSLTCRLQFAAKPKELEMLAETETVCDEITVLGVSSHLQRQSHAEPAPSVATARSFIHASTRHSDIDAEGT